MPPEAVAHYRLRERLGKGAMGDVWLAEDTRLHRLVALKMIPTDSDDASASARLLREARVASSLNHPHVAVVYEVGDAGERPGEHGYIAMEYVRGRTLGDLRKDGRVEAGVCLGLARQIAEALAHAHDHGVVHRDVKPGNVMVNDQGFVKVLDFGLARFAPPSAEDSATWSGAHDTLEGSIVGTLAYMSPEQARGGPVDARSDVFSLGVVLYELLSGRRPFEGRNAVEQIDALLHGAPSPPAGEGRVAPGLGRLVSRMLEKEPSRRPADMHEVLRQLDDLARGREPVAASPTHVVAVLGFANITGRAEDGWLGTGLAETIGAGLSAVPGLVIVSRERVLEVLRALSLPPDSDDPAVAVRLGREVGAAGVVSGGYQCLDDLVRVTVRLVETDTGHVRLNPKVDGRRAAIFEVQDRIVAALVAGLPGPPAPAQPGPEETRSLEAFELFSKGLLNLRAESPESIDRALVFFERAVALDPDYARAHMHLGAALDLKGDYLTTPELSERGLVSLDRALALRPESSEAWRYRGGALTTLGRDAEAIAAFERALSLDPTDASAHSGMGRVHFILRGDFGRAVPAYERALALNPRAGWSALQLSHCATLLRDFARAEPAAHRAVELQRSFLSGRAGLVIVGAHMRLGHALAVQGRHREALAQYADELEFLKSVDHALRGRVFIELHQRIGEAHLRLGEASAAGAALDLALEAWERRARSGVVDPSSRYYAACAHALRGETDAALSCLEEAAARRRRLTIARAAIEPALESLRGHPRFGALLAAG